MPVAPPFPHLQELITVMGQAGRRLAEIDASEGAAGNISVYAGWPLDPGDEFPLAETVPLPRPAPELAGGCFLITGSGRRLREIRDDPPANVGLLTVDPDGHTGTLHTSPRRLFAHL